MTPERWRIIKNILADAAEWPAEEQEQRLQGACAGDPELLAEVLQFLQYEERLEGFIDEPLVDLTSAFELGDEASGTAPKIGARVGPYRLVRLLAQGGMGTVYLAEREEEFEQRVALKLIRRGLVGEQAIRLFHAERQILARLEHPNIARLLDGGTDDHGAPYFVMEFIDGVPVDEYCRSQGLSIRQRIELFLPLCSALTAAHQSLVVHGDLKPDNILVTADGIPKLLDFGISKLLEADPKAPGNPVQPLALTPRYASPEQLRGEAMGTASDVYSLAVVLYQVLTGALPQGLEEENRQRLIHAIFERDPLPASFVARTTALTRLARSQADSRAERRQAPAEDPQTLHRHLSGDLDAILAKALRKEPSQRYPAPEQLADDLRNHLEDLPVSARPATFVYRAGKFLRRHRWGVANTALVLLLTLGFTFALVHQLYQTQRSRDHAQEISTFLITLFQSAAPDRLANEEPTVRELLDAGRAQLESQLGQEPEVRGTLLLRLGEVYSKLGDFEAARELFAEAIELLRTRQPEAAEDLATAVGNLGVVSFQSGDLEAAERWLTESLYLRRRLGHREDLIKPMNNLATLLMARGKPQQAKGIYRESLELRRQRAAAAPEDPNAQGNLATSLRSLAVALHACGELDEAEGLLLEALALRQQLYGPASPAVATVELSLGRLEQSRGNPEAAARLMTRALDTRALALGPDHLHTALAQRDLATLLLQQGEAARARDLLLQARKTLLSLRPPDDPELREVEGLLAESFPGDRGGTD